ncbi:unnamed protein product [Ilex paraguariensis]|uniref:PHD-type domain-containing protein n=1 Tax=Ilex paraguariensis TaxID=185542 RepID=A0ABC8RR19_9AQUA
MGQGEAEVCLPVLDDVKMEIENPLRIESKRDYQCVVDGSETEPCSKKQAKELLGYTELLCAKKQAKVFRDTELESHAKEVKEALYDVDIELCSQNEAKETSNEDICSEVTNPNLSPRENTSSFQTIGSEHVELMSNIQSGCVDVTSDSSGNSTTEEGLREEELNRNDTQGEVTTSHVVLEIPKHVSTTGVRKITFKFSKRKEDYCNQLSTPSTQLQSNGFHDGCHEDPWWTPLAGNGDANRYGKGFYETSRPFLCTSNLELKMSKKVSPDSCPTNVKKLLSTGILEGARVKYISTSGNRVLPGIIKDSGYLCGCSACNFSKVLSAYEFELHAGGCKTRHPNNHIFLENGKPIYNIIQELKTAPLSVLDEVIKNVAGSSVNEEALQVWKGTFQRSIELCKADKNYHTKLAGLYHSTTSFPNQVCEEGCSPTSCSNVLQICMKDSEEERKQIKKPKSYIFGSGVAQKRTTEGGTKKRDNDLHRILFMPNGLPDGTDLAYYSKGKKILGGYKQGNGIVCSCCDTEISPSQFEAHAGWAAKRQPYRHIYTSNGLTLHDIALLLSNGQNVTTSNSDDMCAVCGDIGELIVCGGCPRAFHPVCLGLQCVPTGEWHCQYCRDKFGPGRKAGGEFRPILVRLTRVVKSPESEVGGCVVCRAQDFSVAKFDERTVILCDQCEKEYHVGCLRDSGLCDLKELPKDKWFCCDDCNRIHQALQYIALNGAEVIPAPMSNMINKKLAEKGLSDGAANDIRWQILNGKSRSPEHLLLLSRAAAIFRECFDPIVAKSGRDLIPVMVYGRNISGQEFGGMYCIVLTVKSVVVSAGLLRVFGREVAELPLVATSRENQGKGYFQALFYCIEQLLYSMNVENLVLPAAEEAESIWTKKLGFRRMSDERLKTYTRHLQLTIFKGTSMLEKKVQQLAA